MIIVLYINSDININIIILYYLYLVARGIYGDVVKLHKLLTKAWPEKQSLRKYFADISIKSTQRAQTSANANMWNKSDPGFEFGFSD